MSRYWGTPRDLSGRAEGAEYVKARPGTCRGSLTKQSSMCVMSMSCRQLSQGSVGWREVLNKYSDVHTHDKHTLREAEATEI